MHVMHAQESSYSESMSTLAFGGRVSEIALGAPKKNVESGAVFAAREAARGLDAAVGSERQARREAESRAAAAERSLASARSEVDRLQVSPHQEYVTHCMMRGMCSTLLGKDCVGTQDPDHTTAQH